MQPAGLVLTWEVSRVASSASHTLSTRQGSLLFVVACIIVQMKFGLAGNYYGIRTC